MANRQANGTGRKPFRADLDWNVVYTNPNCEMRAQMGLQAKGYPVFLPTFVKLTRPGNRDRVSERPLFPRYLFVSIDMASGHCLDVRSTDGVETLLCIDGQVAAIPGESLGHLHHIEQSGILDDSKARLEIKPGDLARVKYGPFGGHIVRLQSKCGTERCKVLFELMNSNRSVDMALDNLEPTDYSKAS